MQPIDYLTKFENEFKNDDDRTRIISTTRQQILYSMVRIKKKVALVELKHLYSDERTFISSINNLAFIGVLKRVDDEFIEYVEYKNIEVDSNGTNGTL